MPQIADRTRRVAIVMAKRHPPGLESFGIRPVSPTRERENVSPPGETWMTTNFVGTERAWICFRSIGSDRTNIVFETVKIYRSAIFGFRELYSRANLLITTIIEVVRFCVRFRLQIDGLVYDCQIRSIL